MAEKLSITIALEGGKAIEQQLEGIGKAGQKAFEDISQAAQKAGGFKNLKPEEVTAKLKELGVTGEDALGKITEAVKSATRMEQLVGIVQGVEKGFAGLATAAGAFARALVPIAGIAGAIGVALVKTMSDAAEAINKVDAAAIKAGISIEKFDTLRAGFEAAGLSAKQVESGMSAIGRAAEQAKLTQIADDFKVLQEGMTRGFGGQGTEEWLRLTAAMQGGGKAAEAAKKAIIELGGTIADTGIKSLPEFIAKFGGDVPKAVAAFVEQLRTMPDTAANASRAIAGLDDAGVALVQGFRAGTVPLDLFRDRIGTMTQDMANAATVWETNANKLATSWERFKTAIGGELLVTNTMRELNSILEAINTLLMASPAQWKQAFSDLLQPVNDLIALLDTLWEKIKRIGSSIGAIFAGGGGGPEAGSIPGNAAGGLLGGRGTGTSDSNLAWVSRGEHIMPAAAVRQPGVLALLEALRRSGGNLRGVLDGMGRFAAGGVVPRFAEGGLVGGIGHLGTVDLRTDHGSVTLMASGSAMDQLSRLATTKRITSTGRKPGFIG